MATNTAPQAGPGASNDRPTDPSRSLWHAPLFVLGVAALVAAWFGRPLFPPDQARQLQRNLLNARNTLDKADGDSAYALKLALKAMEASEMLQEHAGEAAFLTGWAYSRQAEKVQGAAAAEAWAKARQHLEQADQAGVPEDDRHRLDFRLARAGLHTGMPLKSVAALLEKAAPQADSRVEAYQLLAKTYERMKPPDLEQALKANHKLRGLEEISDAEAARAMLQGGSLLLQMGKPDDALLSLNKIKDTAAAEVVQQARLLRARCYQQQKAWEQAILQYQNAMADPRWPLPDRAVALYHLGTCYRNNSQDKDAVATWKQCLGSTAPEGTAAAVALADSYLSEPALEPALEALERAVTGHKPGTKWANPHVPEEALRALLVRARKAFQQADRHDLAVKLADHQARFVPAAEALVLKAESVAAWGRKRKAGAAKGGKDELRLASELLAQAAALYEEAAVLPGLKSAEQSEHLYQAAMSYLESGDSTKGASALFRLVKQDAQPMRMGEAWYRLAEHYRGGKDRAKARDAYQECLKYDTRYVYLARYRLAMEDLENGALDDAEAGLVTNLKRLRFEAEPEAMSQSLFALGGLLYRKRVYRRVVHYLEDALSRFKDDPRYRDSPELSRARFQLADSYRQIAAQETQSLLVEKSMSKEAREHFEGQQKLFLGRAAEEFATLDAYLNTSAGQDHLTKEQRTQVPFITAKCYFNLGKYEKALEVYDRLIRTYPNRVEGLDALGGAVQCHAAMGKEDLVRQRLLQIEQALPQVPEEVRKPWAAWLKEARKPLKDL